MQNKFSADLWAQELARDKVASNLAVSLAEVCFPGPENDATRDGYIIGYIGGANRFSVTLCDILTIRTLIDKGMSDEEVWKNFYMNKYGKEKEDGNIGRP